MENAKRGKCSLCQDPVMLSSNNEEEVRKLHKDSYDLMIKK